VGWPGHLRLQYRRDDHGGGRTLAHDAHDGPLRVLQALHPEGPGICHHVLVHPPGGIVGGDTLLIEARLGADTHALITTAGATRFYRSAGETAAQQATLALDARARLEWLPLETIAYRGCLARNTVRLALAPGAEMIGWDVLALGLPAAGEPFEAGTFEQHLEWPGQWLERGRIEASDSALLDGPVGLAGHRVLATAWFCAGGAIGDVRRAGLLAKAREALDAKAGTLPAGATSPDSRRLVVRLLGARVEPVMAALVEVRAAWRELAWGLPANPPRVWRT